MAINYLNSIDLNQNELLQGVVENQPNDASVGSSPVEGQLYFNTTAHVLKQYNGSAWAEVGGGVITLTLNDGTYIDVNSTGDAANPIFAPDLNAVDGTSVAGTRFLSKDNTWDVPTYPSDANTTYELFGVGSTNGTAGIQLDGSDATLDNVLIIGAGTTTVTRSANTLTVTSNDQYDGTVTSVAATHAGNAFTAAIGGNANVNPSVDITMAGTSSQYVNGAGNLTTFPSIPTVSNATITLTAGDVLDGGGAFTLNQSANETITFDLATGGIGAGVIGSASDSIKIDTITVDAYGRITAATTGATGQVNTVTSSNTSTLTATGTINKTLTAVTGAVNASSANLATGAQIQTAIDTALTGVLQFQGTWNASTNSPTLTSSVGTSGDYYIVSVAGNTNLNGITDWEIGDWAVFANTTWTKIDNSQVGDVTGDGAAGRVAFWNSASNITNDAGFTYNSTSNAFGVSGVITASGGNSGEWNSSYDNMITGFSDSGSGTITLTLTQQDGGTLTTSFANPQGTMSSWTIKEGNGTESTAVSNGETLTIAQGAGIQSEMTSTSSGGTIEITNTDRGSSQNIFKNVASSSGTAVADNNNDTLTIVGAGGISTAVSGDTLTITSSNGTNSDYTKVGSIAAGALTGTVTHAFGINTIVQTIDSSGNTVYCEVSRTSTTSVATISVAQATAITILVQKIG